MQLQTLLPSQPVLPCPFTINPSVCPGCHCHVRADGVFHGAVFDPAGI